MIIVCFGITKLPDGNYAMVLNYCPEGNLRNYLQQYHSKLALKDRFKILRSLCEPLYKIHEKDLIHCDLHSGNILIGDGDGYIADLGLCGLVDNESSCK